MAQQNKGCADEGCDRQSCEGCEKSSQNMYESLHELSSIKRVIGVVSGKGGVGKSLVTSMLAVKMSRMGHKVGILDADITGPSIPKVFGITGKAEGDESGIFPQRSHNDIKVMSVNLLLPQDDAPVIWRGPLLAGAVKQFWTDVIWGDLDYLFIDLPPGTGDVPLTVFQSIPLDGIIIVTSPQELVSMIVKKAHNMARQMHIPVLGVVENFSYIKCPDCGKRIDLFGKSNLEKTAQEIGVKVLGRIPVDPELARLADSGEFERFDNDELDGTVREIEKNLS